MSIVILPLLPDPPDVVMQGEQFGKAPLQTYNAGLAMLVQGDISTAYPVPSGVPRAMIGQSDWYGILPRKIGPMRVSGGEIVWIDIGTVPPPFPNIDPIQAWLNAPFPIDVTGMWFDLSADLMGALEATNSMMLPNAVAWWEDAVPVTIPRGAIARSRAGNLPTFVSLPPSFQQHMMDAGFAETTQRYIVEGVTRNNNGSPLGNCEVLVLSVDKLGPNKDANANPVVEKTTSDGSGNFQIQVDGRFVYQVIAYLANSPDVAGSSVRKVTLSTR